MPVSKGPDESLTSTKNSAILRGRNAAEVPSTAIEVDAEVPHSVSMVHLLLSRRTKLNLTPSFSHFCDPVMHPLFSASKDFKATMI